jgi:hypothetical protein
VDLEAHCRFCGRNSNLEAAHVLGRAYDELVGAVRVVHPEDIVPLCGPYPAGCHGAQHRHEIDVWPRLTPAELARAISLAGYGEAERHIRGRNPLPHSQEGLF